MAFQLDTNIPLMAQAPRSFDPMAAFAGALQLRGQVEANRALAEQRHTLADQRRMLIEKAQREEAAAEQLRGLTSWTPETVYPIIGPEAGAKVLKGIADFQTAQLKSGDEVRGSMLTRLAAIKALPESMRPEAWDLAVKDYAGRGLIDPKQIGAYSPELIEQYERELLGPEKVADLKIRRDTLAQNTAHDAATLEETKRGHDLTAAAQAESNKVARGNLAVSQSRLGLERQRFAAESAGAASAMTPEGLQVAASQYIQTGQMPPLGMGKAAADARMRILNEAGKIAASGGGDPMLNAALYKADSQTLTQQQKTLSAITAFENTAKKNLEVMEREAAKIIDFGGPWINKPLREAAAGLGSERMAAFNTARAAVVPEIARILTNPNLTGVLSDSARQEIDELLRGDASVKQMRESIRILRTDMDTRRKSISDEIKAITGRIGSRRPGASSQPAGGNAADPLGILR
jgi:hypothetical protein